MLIGAGGERINKLQEVTKCQIFVDWKKDTPNLDASVSTVHLKGTKNAIAQAKGEITAIIRMFGGIAGKAGSQVILG